MHAHPDITTSQAPYFLKMLQPSSNWVHFRLLTVRACTYSARHRRRFFYSLLKGEGYAASIAMMASETAVIKSLPAAVGQIPPLRRENTDASSHATVLATIPLLTTRLIKSIHERVPKTINNMITGFVFRQNEPCRCTQLTSRGLLALARSKGQRPKPSSRFATCQAGTMPPAAQTQEKKTARQKRMREQNKSVFFL